MYCKDCDSKLILFHHSSNVCKEGCQPRSLYEALTDFGYYEFWNLNSIHYFKALKHFLYEQPIGALREQAIYELAYLDDIILGVY